MSPRSGPPVLHEHDAECDQPEAVEEALDPPPDVRMCNGADVWGKTFAGRRASSSATTPAAVSTGVSGSGTIAPALPAQALASPACSIAAVASAELGSVRTAMLSTGGSPFGVAVTPDGGYGFAAVQDGGTGHGVIDVLRMAKTASGQPVLVRSIPVADQPLGETITPDGKYLLAADGNGAVVISVARAESGATSAVLGMLAARSGSGAGQGALSASAIEVATSRDGRYARDRSPSPAPGGHAGAGWRACSAGQPVRVVTAANGTQVWVTAR